MSNVNVQVLRELVMQRLTAAAEDIFGLFDRMIAEYEEELSRSKEENERQHNLLDAVLNPQLRLHRADAQQLLLSVVKEEGPTEQQEGSLSQEGEQLQGLEEADTTLTLPVTSEDDDEEKAQSSQLHKSQTEENTETEQLKTGADGEDCGGPVPAGKSSPDSPLQQPAIHDKTLHSSESETDDSRDWEDTKGHQSHLNPLQNNGVSRSDMECNTGKTSVSSSKCTRSSGGRGHLQKRTRRQTRAKTFSCSVCGETFLLKKSLTSHKKLHSERKPLSCSVCQKTFKWKGEVVKHMKIHTMGKPFSCSTCGMTFTKRQNLTKHLKVHAGEKHLTCSVSKTSYSNSSNFVKHIKSHTREKPFSCSICHKKFTQKGYLIRHSIIHTGEKPFRCPVCSKSFAQKETLSHHLPVHKEDKQFTCSVCKKMLTYHRNLKRHLTIHTGEKPFSCLACDKKFAHNGDLRRHLLVHTGEKPFSCSVCEKSYTRLNYVKNHKCAGERRNK